MPMAVASISGDRTRRVMAPTIHFRWCMPPSSGWVTSMQSASPRRVRSPPTSVRSWAGGIDPIKHRDTLAAQQKAATAMTFEAAAKRYYEEHGAEWRGRNTAHLFKTLMREQAYSVIGKLPVADLTMDDALRVLRPIWQVKNCSAKRLMFWCRLSIDATRGQPGGLHVDRLNPFTWVGCLKHRLPDPAKFVREKPHADLDYRRIPAHMAILRATDGIAERMAEFCILTTVRTRPIIEMQSREVDFAADVWNIPDVHEKSFEDHRVPLSDRALEILRQQRPADAKPNDLVWASARTGRQRSTNTMLRVLRRWDTSPAKSPSMVSVRASPTGGPKSRTSMATCRRSPCRTPSLA